MCLPFFPSSINTATMLNINLVEEQRPPQQSDTHISLRGKSDSSTRVVKRLTASDVSLEWYELHHAPVGSKRALIERSSHGSLICISM